MWIILTLLQVLCCSIIDWRLAIEDCESVYFISFGFSLFVFFRRCGGAGGEKVVY